MHTINNLPVENLRLNNYSRNFEQLGDKFEGYKNKVLINYTTKDIDRYDITYIDIEKSDFIKAIINGEGDFWDGEFSSKGQRIMGDYIIHETHIQPNTVANFIIDKFMYLTVIVNLHDTDTRQIITHYDSDYTDKFSDVAYITLEDNKNILINNTNIKQLYAIPAIIPEDYAETLLTEELISPPYFKINNETYIGNIDGINIEALGRGESINFECRRVDE